MNIVTYPQFYRAIDKLCYAVAYSNLKIDAIVPALRSGMIPAFKIAERLHVPIMIGEELHGGERLTSDKPIKNILIVDDSINSGFAMQKEINKYNGKGYNIYTCAVIAHPGAKDAVNFHAMVVPQPRFFEWNMFNTNNTRHIMFDMDGVICINPRVFDDDGPSYQNEIKDEPALFVPSFPVHSIVTNRIERWRPETEAWLKKHGVSYGELVMRDFDTAVERRQGTPAGVYKAKHYGDSSAELFIESDVSQAETIHNITGKPVYCVDSASFLGV